MDRTSHTHIFYGLVGSSCCSTEIIIYMNFPSIFQQIISPKHQTKKKEKKKKYYDEDGTKCVRYRLWVYTLRKHIIYIYIEPFLFIFGTFLAIRFDRGIERESFEKSVTFVQIVSVCRRQSKMEFQPEINVYLDYNVCLQRHNNKPFHFISLSLSFYLSVSIDGPHAHNNLFVCDFVCVWPTIYGQKSASQFDLFSIQTICTQCWRRRTNQRIK